MKKINPKSTTRFSDFAKMSIFFCSVRTKQQSALFMACTQLTGSLHVHLSYHTMKRCITFCSRLLAFEMTTTTTTVTPSG